MVERNRPLRFSRAGVRGLQVSAALSVNDRVKEMWAAGQNVYHLAFGESRFPVHPKVAEALCRNVQKRSYLPAAGIQELKEAIAGHYRRVFDMELAPSQPKPFYGLATLCVGVGMGVSTIVEWLD